VASEAVHPKSAVCGLSRSQIESAFEYSVNVRKKVVWVKFGKKISERAIEQYMRQLRRDPSFASSYNEIVDLTALEEIQVCWEELMRVADMVDPFSFASKRAFIVQNAFQEHEARMYQVLRSGRSKIRLCSSMDEAQRWIFGDQR